MSERTDQHVEQVWETPSHDEIVKLTAAHVEAMESMDDVEAVWQQAARLTGFSRYAPTDDIAADDSTEVFVWYSPTAIHFGIRAFAEPGTVHATLADRDKMYSDDYVGIFLGAFNDGRHHLLLRTVGRKSGKEHKVALPTWVDPEGRRVVVASFAGAPGHPSWYLNLSDRTANPEVLCRVQGGRTFWSEPEILEGDVIECYTTQSVSRSAVN